MFPGLTSKASESTLAAASIIDAKTDIIKITGTGTAINTINPHFMNTFSGFLVLVPVDGTLDLGTSGNILVGLTASPQNKAIFMMFVRSLSKWVVNQGN